MNTPASCKDASGAQSLAVAVVDCQPFDAALAQRTGYGGFTETFAHLFAKASPVPVQVLRYNAQALEFPDLARDGVDAVLVTGSFSSAYASDAWIARLKENIRRVCGRMPLIGICFGHQVIAEALGGRAGAHADGPEVAYAEFAVDDGARQRLTALCGHNALVLPDAPRLIYFHFDEVKQLPPGAVNLGGNAHSRYEAYFMPDDRVLCWQGHPEFGLDLPLMRALLQSSRDRGRLSAEKYAAAVASLDRPTDSTRVASLLVQFILTQRSAAQPNGIGRQNGEVHAADAVAPPT